MEKMINQMEKDYNRAKECIMDCAYNGRDCQSYPIRNKIEKYLKILGHELK